MKEQDQNPKKPSQTQNNRSKPSQSNNTSITHQSSTAKISLRNNVVKKPLKQGESKEEGKDLYRDNAKRSIDQSREGINEGVKKSMGQSRQKQKPDNTNNLQSNFPSQSITNNPNNQHIHKHNYQYQPHPSYRYGSNNPKLIVQYPYNPSSNQSYTPTQQNQYFRTPSNSGSIHTEGKNESFFVNTNHSINNPSTNAENMDSVAMSNDNLSGFEQESHLHDGRNESAQHSGKNSNSSSFYENSQKTIQNQPLPQPYQSFANHGAKHYAINQPYQGSKPQPSSQLNRSITFTQGKGDGLNPAFTKDIMNPTKKTQSSHMTQTQKPLQTRQTSINKNGSYCQSFNRVQTQTVPQSRVILQNNSFVPGNYIQNNSKSSMTVRNIQYGRKHQSQERTKSHTKNYSIAETLHNPIQRNQSLTYTNTPNLTSSRGQPFFNYQQVSSQPQQQNPTNFSSVPINLQQKPYMLDSIAQKDEFNRFFVRGNQPKQDSAQNIKLIHRQSSKYCPKQKINVVSDNSMIKSFDSKNFTGPQQIPNFTNLRYIKSPTNAQQKLQRIRDYDKYLKVSYEPAPINQRHKLAQITHKQSQKAETRSVNSSFKQNSSLKDNNFKDNSKPQTGSLYQYFRGQKLNNYVQKPMSVADYGHALEKQQLSSDNLQTKSGNKYRYMHQRNQALQIYSSNTDFHQDNTEGLSSPPQQAYRKTMDVNSTVPDFSSYYQENKVQSKSFGVDQQRQNQGYDNDCGKGPQIKLNAMDLRIYSPDPRGYKANEYENNSGMYASSPQYTMNPKLTVFSPSQKSMKPAQKSHFLSQNQSESNKQAVRNKKSIKKMLVSQSKHPKSQILYNLNFKDLLKGQNNNEQRPNSRTILELITRNQLTRIFCSTFKIGQNENGCDCMPKCYWVDKWIEKLNRNRNWIERSMMKNLDRRGMDQSGSQNLWKNMVSQEVIVFNDVGNRQNNSENSGNGGGKSTEEIQTFKQIEKDIPRTCSDHPTFKSAKYRQFLRQVLINFYYLEPSLGYVQGMNIIAASIVYHSKTLYQSLQLMDLIMHILDYKILYTNDMKKCRDLASKTCHIIRHYCYDMYNYVTVQNEVDIEMFIIGWYFSMLGTFVPLECMHLVINKFIDRQFAGLMEIIVTYFIFIKDILMEKIDPNQMMEQLSLQNMVQRSKKIDWIQLISVSDKLKLTLDMDNL